MISETYFEQPKRRYTNPLNGQFLKGHTPHNKGKSIDEWCPDKEKQERMKKGLELGRGKYARKNFPGWNRKAVVYVDEDGISHVYSSGASAGRAHHLSGRNIRSVCSGLRKTCGGKVWYWYDDKRWMSLCKC